MFPFDQIAAGARAVGDAVSGVATVVGEAIGGAADAAGAVVQSGLDSARDWVDENMGDSFWGDVARGAIDVGKVAAGLLEFGVNLVGIGVETGGKVLGDVLSGDWGAIPGHLQEGWEAVQEEWQELQDEVATYAIKSSRRGRDVTGSSKLVAKSWSMAAGISPNNAGSPDPRTYRDTGKRYEFALREGRVWFREVTMTCAEPDWKKLAFNAGDPEGTRVSFDNDRAGSRREAPEFEMIVASADRVFAKEKGKDHFYFLLMDELFWGLPSLNKGVDEDTVETLSMPSNYFKIDPEKNLPGARSADLLIAVSGTLPKIPQAERVPLFREVMRKGMMEMMVKVKPRLWHRIDCRPPLHGAQPPDDVPTYPHVVYGSRLLNGWNPVPDVTQLSIDYEHVLDIGVGNMHFHEQWTRVYGGEMQALFVQNMFNVLAYTLIYALMNGPMADGDGFCDGTCNFYQLVRLRPTGKESRYAILWCDEQSLFTQRWRLADLEDNDWVEQSVTPTRMKLNFSLASALDNSRDGHLHAFRRSQVWSPFREGCITEHSRMTVSRQVIIVSGVDPATGHEELYSTNFSYGTADRTWRWRGFTGHGLNPHPMDVYVDRPPHGPDQKNENPNVVFPASLHLREDMTLCLQGTAMGVDGSTIRGRWVQSYLPASHLHVPSAEEHADTAAGATRAAKPFKGYSHPWNFWTEEIFSLADRFSHFGVYATVDARTQYYSLDLLSDLPVIDGSEWHFIDAPASVTVQTPAGPVQVTTKGPELGQLYIKGRKVNYEQLATLLGQDPANTLMMIGQLLLRSFDGSTRVNAWSELVDDILFKWEESPSGTREADEQFRASRRSMYNFNGRFKLLKRGALGWIAVWADKRDDDLMSLSDLPMEVKLAGPPLSEVGTEGQRIGKHGLEVSVTIPSGLRWSSGVRFNSHHRVVRPPSVLFASVALAVGTTGQQSLHVLFRTALTRHEMDTNIWRIHIGALSCSQNSMVVPLLTAVVADSMVSVEGQEGSFEADFPIPPERSDDIGRFVSNTSREQFGTSIWFEGPTGLVAIAEQTTIG